MHRGERTRTLGEWANPQGHDIPKILRHPHYNVPEVLSQCAIETAKGTAKHFLTNYMADFPQHFEDGRGVFLRGDFGSGKSGAAVCIMRQCLFFDLNTYFVSTDELVKNIIRFKEISDDGPVEDYVKDYVHVLVLDDLKVAKGKYGEMSINIVEDVLKHRANERVITIVTSNLSLDEIKNDFGGAVSDIISTTCIPIKLDDVAWRAEQSRKNIEFSRKYTGPK